MEQSKAVDDEKLIIFIKTHQGCKFRDIMNNFNLERKDKDDYDFWLKYKYRALDLQLQTLKGEHIIEYLRGKGGGWFIKH